MNNNQNKKLPSVRIEQRPFLAFIEAACDAANSRNFPRTIASISHLLIAFREDRPQGQEFVYHTDNLLVRTIMFFISHDQQIIPHIESVLAKKREEIFEREQHREDYNWVIRNLTKEHELARVAKFLGVVIWKTDKKKKLEDIKIFQYPYLKRHT